MILRSRRAALAVAAMVGMLAAVVVGYVFSRDRDGSTAAGVVDGRATVSSTALASTATTAASTSRATATASPRTRVGRTTVPTGTAATALCTESTSNFGVAQTYVGLAEIGQALAAQGCVLPNRVPVEVAQRLDGMTFLAVTRDQHATVIDFQSTDSAMRITVTTARESDGRYYVTAVAVH